MPQEEFKPLFLKEKKVSAWENFKDWFGKFFFGISKDYYEFESQLEKRKKFPFNSWQNSFPEDSNKIEVFCMELKNEYHCWVNPFFIPEDLLEYVLLGDGDYECFPYLVDFLDEQYGVDLSDEEFTEMFDKGFTFGELFEYVIKHKNRDRVN